MSESNWMLEVYCATSAGDYCVESFENSNVFRIRIALASIPDRKFIVKTSADATAADRKASTSEFCRRVDDERSISERSYGKKTAPRRK